MARARKSHKAREEETKRNRHEAAKPYGAVGANPYVVYCDYPRPDVEVPKLLIVNFAAKYAAAWFINQVLEGDDYEWVDPLGSRKAIRTKTLGIRISMYGDDLAMLLDYEPTEAEAAWEDEQWLKQIQGFKYGRTADDRRVRDRGSDDRGETGGDSGERDGDVQSRGKRSKREKKEPKPKIDKSNLVSANQIASELGVEGREVRGVLRAMKLEKPEGGWLFDKKTADEIREKVKKGLKEAKKKKKDKKKDKKK